MTGGRSQRGQAIVLIAIMLAVVVGMAALAIDGARAYALRRDLQAAVDGAALAAADNFQQTGSYISAEQAATTNFGVNAKLYSGPACAPAYGSPGASPLTVTCTYSDGTVLTQVVSALGAAGSQFTVTGARSLALQFARILTNGTTPRLSAAASGGVNNLLYTPTLAALNQAGCGGASGSAISVGGGGTLTVQGDIVSSGSVAVTSSIDISGDVYARCQSSIPNTSFECYPSGNTTPCTFPDVAGATKSGYHFVDPDYPPPAVVGGSQGAPGSTVILSPGIYAADPGFNSGDCWFLSGGVYDWQRGFTNTLDFVSNELKPPEEPQVGNNTSVSSHQFWNTNGVRCAGAYQLTTVGVPNPLAIGTWGIVVTSVRNDTYAGTSYRRESAPSLCRTISVAPGDAIQVAVSNVPGATSYNIYFSKPSNGCNGPWGLGGNLPVSGTPLNSNTNSCPNFSGIGCSLGHESAIFDGTVITALFSPNPLAAPGVFGAYPPDAETAPLQSNLPNQNPNRGPGAAGDRANENDCDSVVGVLVSCPAAITPGAVVFYLPSGGCLTSNNSGDTFVFSGYQYNWLAVYEPGSGYPPANTCPNVLGARSNSAFVGLVYTPLATMNLTSAYSFESGGMGGLIAKTLSFTGSLPTINFSPAYAPVPPAARLTG